MLKKSLRLIRTRMLAFFSAALLGTLLLILACLSAKAAEVQNSQEISGGIATVQLQNTVPNKIRDPRLSDIEWARYEQFMQGMEGVWYPALSPAAVLGMRAETNTERRHYAELVAQEQHDKLAREILFNHEFYLAIHRLYPNEPVIQAFDKTPFNPHHPDGHHV